MILQLKVKNYRSYKEETVFSMEANDSSSKLFNVWEIENEKESFKLLKTAIIYGANASGKSNIIRVLFELTYLILNKPVIDQKIRIYEPFLFDKNSSNKPTEIELRFKGPNNLKYEYRVIIYNNIILEEDLYFFPEGEKINLFSRKPFDPETHFQKGTLGDLYNNKEYNLFENQLLLSKFGDDEPHELLTQVFLYFRTYSVINATNKMHRQLTETELIDYLYNNEIIKEKLSKLIKGADTKVNNILIVKDQERNLGNSRKVNYSVFGNHDVYDNDRIIEEYNLPIKEESVGTQSLYFIGAEVLKVLDKGGVIIVDELDTSLHPYLTKMIVMLFQSNTTNPKNAQLIFTTHDVSLLDKDLIRQDQIWIAEKNEKGSTDLYSLQDFEELKEDVPLERWYLAGKFGGLPQIKSIESLFE
ncbi:ATP-binding protein [Flavobacterium sp. ANB]|uniref:AAA family ATPase n=1 Tax=unclassified Flavobacterium TaxID=196869 RepID=UPI0012B70806|nr:MULTISPECIES: ATP-binding protein [unclassified Flavobacterium]MBF4515845.1 ATP-binding protein [Flavobacterium sp. ANB]MTD68847.1 AAA family ATPase [Flavobacterium sp. LC2016-13]